MVSLAPGDETRTTTRHPSPSLERDPEGMYAGPALAGDREHSSDLRRFARRRRG
jgi:hypothetical protein